MDIVAWLRNLGLGKYEAVFRENEITEKVLPNLTALGGLLGLRLRSSGRFSCYRRRTAKLADGREYLPPMPERHANVLEVLIGQMAQYRDIDLVLGKALGVLGHAELFEPFRNLLHRGPLRI